MTLLTILACAVIAAPLIHFAPHLEGDRLRDDMKRDDDAAEAQGWLDRWPTNYPRPTSTKETDK